jgi:hypothetical protein
MIVLEIINIQKIFSIPEPSLATFSRLIRAEYYKDKTMDFFEKGK